MESAEDYKKYWISNYDHLSVSYVKKQFLLKIVSC